MAPPALLVYPFGMRILLAVLATSGLFGHVSRGPITPVCMEGKPCSAPVVGAELRFSRNGVLAGTAMTGPAGEYRVVLRPGAYLVRIVKGGKPMLRFTPAYVRVPTGAAIRVDFSIDTGIR